MTIRIGVERMAMDFAAKKDALVVEAIEDRLGYAQTKAQLASLVKTRRLVRTEQAGTETIHLDGKPLIEFYPPTYARDGMKVSMSMNFRRL